MKVVFNVISRFFILCLVLLITNCQQEDDLEHQKQTHVVNQKSTTKTISGKDVPKVLNFIQSKSSSKMQFTLDDSNSPENQFRSHEENLSLTTTLTDQIKQVTNSYGKSNYTFSLIEEQAKEGIYFLNLVVKEYKEGFYLYIVKYVPDVDWMNANQNIIDFETFVGSIYYYTDEGLYFAKMEMQNGISTSFNKHPCDGGNNDNGGGNSGGGSSDDTTGSSNTDSGSGISDGGGSTGNSDVGGGGGSTISIFCNCPPEHGENQIMNGFCTCDSVTIEANKSMNDSLRHPCDPSNSDCAGETDCEFGWDDDCSCLEEPNENDDVAVTVNLADIATFNSFVSALDSDLQDWVNDEENIEYRDYVFDFLVENDFSEDAKDVIEELLEELVSWPFPHCSSFEFAQPGGESVKACAVTNLSDTFHTIRVNSDGSFYYAEVDVNYPLIFFTMPTYMTNGQAATLTAEAVNTAFDLTQEWYLANPNATQEFVGAQLSIDLIASMSAIGGAMTQIPPFDIPSPAPFITNLFTTGNCN